MTFEPMIFENYSFWPYYRKYVSFGLNPFIGSEATAFTMFQAPLADLHLWANGPVTVISFIYT